MDMTSATQAGFSGSLASQAIKDSTGAQLISKTLDKLNAVPGEAAGVNREFQFQKEVLNAAGIGNKLDVEV